VSTKLVIDGREFEISPDVWEAWKLRARPFESPDDVLRRSFGLGGVPPAVPPESHGEEAGRGVVSSPATRRSGSRRKARTKPTGGSSRRSRIPSHLLLPEAEYEMPILKALAEGGGRRPTREVVAAVGEMLSDRLHDADVAELPNGGGPRWQNRVQFVRLRLVREGLLESDSPRGVWEISQDGRQRLSGESL
jgi:hypothetical protein